jgi:hypothetical protein
MPPYWQHGPIIVRKGNFVFCDSISIKECSIYGAILLVRARLRRKWQETANTYLPPITETQKKNYVFKHWRFSNFLLNILNTWRKSNTNVCSSGELWIRKKKKTSLYTNSASPILPKPSCHLVPGIFCFTSHIKMELVSATIFFLCRRMGCVIFTLCVLNYCMSRLPRLSFNPHISPLQLFNRLWENFEFPGVLQFSPDMNLDIWSNNNPPQNYCVSCVCQSSGIVKSREGSSGTQQSSCLPPHLRTETGPVSETLFPVFRTLDNGQSPEKTTILSVIHHRQHSWNLRVLILYSS